MGTGAPSERARTLLEQLIRERNESHEEFAEFATALAREHGEPATLSARHVQRLVTGRRADGQPVTVQPATARLLERIFGLTVNELLSPSPSSAAHRLRVALAVVTRGTDVLLVCRRDHAGGLSWQFPAGMVKPGTESATTAVRETLAETGVTCVYAETIGSRVHPVTRVVCDYVRCDYLSGEARNADIVENADVAWIATSDLARLIPPERVYPPVLDALRLAQAG